MLQETKEVLEDQLEGWRARSDQIHQLEKHGLLLKATVHDMEQVRLLNKGKVNIRSLSSFPAAVKNLLSSADTLCLHSRSGRQIEGASRSCRRRTWLCVWLKGGAWRSRSTWAGS